MTRIVLLLSAAIALPAQDFKGLQEKVAEFTLSNGFRFVLAERHDAPVIAFVTYVRAGTADDTPGRTGLASFFERLAFKGTESLGSRDPAAEKKALDALEDAYNRLDAEKAKGRRASELELVRLEMEVQSAANLAQSFAAPHELQAAFDENSAAGVSVRVTADASQTRMVLPSNRAELWFLLESQRLSRPVFRDFYRERDEAAPARQREAETPAVKLLTTLASAAFSEHPYRNPARGWPAEVSQLRHADARQFFERHYAPGNITIGIAGDIRPDEARRLAEKYFGPIAARPLPPPSRAQEPPQTGPRTAVIENSVQPLLAIGFKRPDRHDRDNAALDVIEAALAASRSSLLARELIETRRIAATVSVESMFPGGRSPSLFTIAVAPLPGHTAEENEKEVAAVLTRLQTAPLDEATLGRAKARVRSNLVRKFSDNASIAAALAESAAEDGDWRAAFTGFDAAAKVTAEQVQLAASRYFVPSRRTTVWMVPPPPVRVAAPKGGAEE